MGDLIEVEVRALMFDSGDFDDLAGELRSLGYEARLARPMEERSLDFPLGLLVWDFTP